MSQTTPPPTPAIAAADAGVATPVDARTMVGEGCELEPDYWQKRANQLERELIAERTVAKEACRLLTQPAPHDAALREKVEAAILAQGCLEEYEGDDRGRQWAHTAQTWLWPGDSVVVMDRQELVDAIMALFPTAPSHVTSLAGGDGLYAYLVGTGKCPVMHEGKLAFVAVPGFGKESLKLALEKAHENLASMVDPCSKSAKKGNNPDTKCSAAIEQSGAQREGG